MRISICLAIIAALVALMNGSSCLPQERRPPPTMTSVEAPVKCREPTAADDEPDRTSRRAQTEGYRWSIKGELEYYRSRSRADGRDYTNCGEVPFAQLSREDSTHSAKVNNVIANSIKFIIVVELPDSYLPHQPIVVLSECKSTGKWACTFWRERSDVTGISFEVPKEPAARIFEKLNSVAGRIDFGKGDGWFQWGESLVNIPSAFYTYVTYGEQGAVNRCAGYAVEDVLDISKRHPELANNVSAVMTVLGELLKITLVRIATEKLYRLSPPVRKSPTCR